MIIVRPWVSDDVEVSEGHLAEILPTNKPGNQSWLWAGVFNDWCSTVWLNSESLAAKRNAICFQTIKLEINTNKKELYFESLAHDSLEKYTAFYLHHLEFASLF
jgi:hypothetical protein